MFKVAFNQNIKVIKTNLLKIKGEFDRWVEPWQEFTKNFAKFNNNIKQLNTTHNKIHIQKNFKWATVRTTNRLKLMKIK